MQHRRTTPRFPRLPTCVAILSLVGASCSSAPTTSTSPRGEAPGGEGARGDDVGGDEPAAPRLDETAGTETEARPAALCSSGETEVDLGGLNWSLAERLLRAVGASNFASMQDGPHTTDEERDFWVTKTTCAELAAVEALDLGGGVETLRGLPALPRLRRLRAGTVVDGDLTPLRSAPALTEIIIGPMQPVFAGHDRVDLPINPHRLNVLAELPALETLRLSHVSLAGTPGWLSEVQRVRVLELRRCELETLEPLAELAALEKLLVPENRIVDLTPLRRLSRLRALDITQNPVSDLSPLASTSIEDLQAGFTQVRDIAPLEGMPRLAEAWLCHTPAIDDADAQEVGRRLRRRGVRITVVPTCTRY